MFMSLSTRHNVNDKLLSNTSPQPVSQSVRRYSAVDKKLVPMSLVFH